MNNLVFNNPVTPLYIADDARLLLTASREGNAYVTTANLTFLITVLGGGGALILSNDASSPKQIIIDHINLANVGSSTISKIEILKDATMEDGTTATTINTNFGSSNLTSTINKYNINLASAPVSGGTAIETISGLTATYSSLLSDALIIPPNHSIAVRAYGTLTLTLHLVAEIVYWEEAL